MNTTNLIFTFLVLIMAAYTDLSKRSIPNWLTFGGMAIAIALTFIHPSYVMWFYLVGLLPALSMLLINLKQEQFGMGDVKLMVFVGLAIGGLAPIFILAVCFVLMFIYSVIRLFVVVKRPGIPMAPFILAATAVVLLLNISVLPII
jgi:Flp pilus assembly protein protease CpaA